MPLRHLLQSRGTLTLPDLSILAVFDLIQRFKQSDQPTLYSVMIPIMSHGNTPLSRCDPMPDGLCFEIAVLLEYPVTQRHPQKTYIGFSSLVWS